MPNSESRVKQLNNPTGKIQSTSNTSRNARMAYILRRVSVSDYRKVGRALYAPITLR